MPLESRVKIDELNDAGPLTGAEKFPLSQGGAAVKEDLDTIGAKIIAALTTDLSGGLVSTGAAGTYVVNSARNPAALTDGFCVVFEAHQNAAGADTLQIDGLPAKGLTTGTGAAIAALDILAGGVYAATYKAGVDKFRLHSVGPKVQPAPGSVLATAPQCRLEYINSTLIRLRPFGGRQIPIPSGGVPILRTITGSGVDFDTTVTPTALGTYFVYAYWTGSALALELSTTAWNLDLNTGLPIKGGDQTRLLVGLVSLLSANTFSDSQTARCVLSYWNRRPREIVNAQTTVSLVTNSTSYVHISAAAAFSVLCWGDSPMQLAAFIYYSHSAANGRGYGCFFDNGVAVDGGVGMNEIVSIGNVHGLSISVPGHPATEGLHSFELRFKTGGAAGNLTIAGAASSPDRTTVRAMVWG